MKRKLTDSNLGAGSAFVAYRSSHIFCSGVSLTEVSNMSIKENVKIAPKGTENYDCELEIIFRLDGSQEFVEYAKQYLSNEREELELLLIRTWIDAELVKGVSICEQEMDGNKIQAELPYSVWKYLSGFGKEAMNQRLLDIVEMREKEWHVGIHQDTIRKLDNVGLEIVGILTHAVKQVYDVDYLDSFSVENNRTTMTFSPCIVATGEPSLFDYFYDWLARIEDELVEMLEDDLGISVELSTYYSFDRTDSDILFKGRDVIVVKWE